MELAQEIIFYRLGEVVDASFIVKSDGIKVGRLVFFQKGMNCSQKAVIIDGQTIKKLDIYCDTQPIQNQGTLYICLGRIPKHHGSASYSLIHISSNIDASILFNFLQEIYDRFDRWDGKLKTICFERGRFQSMIDYTEDVIFNPISLMDKEFHWVAYCQRSHAEGLVERFVDSRGNAPFDLVNDLLVSATYCDQCKKTEVYSYVEENKELICKNFFHENQYVGRISISPSLDEKNKLPYYEAILEHLAGYMSKLYQIHLSFDQKEIDRNSLRNQILDYLHDKEVSEEQWAKDASESGWKKDDSYLLIQLRPNPRYDKNTYCNYVGAEMERQWKGCVYFEYRNRLMLFVNENRFSSTEHSDLRQALAYFLRECLMVAGISRTFDSLTAIRQAWAQTQVAMEYGIKNTPTFWSYSFDNYCLKYMLNKSTGEFAPEHICNSKLLILKRHDEQKNTEYYLTLKTYFNCKFNASAAAKKLFLHRTSFLNRLERIDKLTKINFDSLDELLHFFISFRILDDE